MIRKLVNYLNGKKEMVNDFHVNSKFMSSGEYVFDHSIEYIVRKDKDTKQRANDMFYQKDYIKVLIQWVNFLLKNTIFSKSMIIPEQNNQIIDFTGTIFTPVRSTNGYIDKRIFDLSRNKVLTIFTNEKDYRLVIENYAYFKNYFKMPAIIWTNDEHLLIMEELITFQPKHGWSQNDYYTVMEDIFYRYTDYFHACEVKGIYMYTSPADLLHSLPVSEEFYFIRNNIDIELFDLPIPCLKLHGDLWTSNTLLKKENNYEVHYIDWEFSKEFTFFYDFFMMMWLEVYMNNNYIYIEKYIQGEYDYFFKKIFSIFHLTFHPHLRIDYFHIFFLNFFKDRYIYFDDKNKRYVFKQYKRLFDKINKIKY